MLRFPQVWIKRTDINECAQQLNDDLTVILSCYESLSQIAIWNDGAREELLGQIRDAANRSAGTARKLLQIARKG